MTTFTRTWNASYEGNPPSGQALSEGATRIQELKEDVRERLEIDHEYGTEGSSTSNAGEHKKITMLEQSSAPSSASNKLMLYSYDVGGVTELFTRDSSGNILQLTSLGAFNLVKTQNSWSGGNTHAAYNIAYASSITPNYQNGNVQKVTLTGNVTVGLPTNPVSNGIFTLIVVNDSTPRTITWNASFKKTAGLDISLTASASAQDIFTMLYDGTYWCIISVAKDTRTAV